MQNDREDPYHKKMKISVKRVTRGSRDHFWEYWDPLHISATAEARNLKFGTHNNREVPYPEKWKFGPKGVARGSSDHIAEFCDPLHISETAEARNAKFRMQIDHEA